MVSHYCGVSLLKNIIILALIDLVCEAIGVALTTFHLVNVIKHAKELRKTSADEESSTDDKALYLTVAVAIASHTVHVALYLFQTGLSILLLFGAFQKSIPKCRVWFNITAVILLITVISTLVNYIFGSETGRSKWTIGPTLFLFLYKGYMLWIVHSFIQLLRFNNHTIRYQDPDQNPDEVQDDLI